MSSCSINLDNMNRKLASIYENRDVNACNMFSRKTELELNNMISTYFDKETQPTQQTLWLIKTLNLNHPNIYKIFVNNSIETMDKAGDFGALFNKINVFFELIKEMENNIVNDKDYIIFIMNETLSIFVDKYYKYRTVALNVMPCANTHYLIKSKNKINDIMIFLLDIFVKQFSIDDVAIWTLVDRYSSAILLPMLHIFKLSTQVKPIVKLSYLLAYFSKTESANIVKQINATDSIINEMLECFETVNTGIMKFSESNDKMMYEHVALFVTFIHFEVSSFIKIILNTKIKKHHTETKKIKFFDELSNALEIISMDYPEYYAKIKKCIEDERRVVSKPNSPKMKTKKVKKATSS
jgi:hypothetical protein